jgi:hypothetical protein
MITERVTTRVKLCGLFDGLPKGSFSGRLD